MRVRVSAVQRVGFFVLLGHETEGNEMKSVLISASLFFLLVLQGCAHVVTAKETYTSSGQRGFIIDCSGDSDTHLIMHNPTWADCYIKAGEICANRGYKILGRSDEQGALSGALVSTTSNSGVGTAFGETKYFRGMLIQCNESEPRSIKK